MLRQLSVVVWCVLASGCLAIGGTGGTGGSGAGGGSGGGSGSFRSGFTYTRSSDRNVYLAASSDYSAPAVLTQSGLVHSPSLSKDKSQVVFVQGSGASATIATVSVSTHLVTTVLASTASVKDFQTPVFSPDGRTIAFSYDDGGISSSLGLVNVDGTSFRRLIGTDALAWALPAFSPDGTSILAGAGSAGFGLDQLQVVNVSSGQAQLVGTLGNEAMTLGSRLTWSPDGARAAFDARISTGATRIFAMDLATKAVTKVNEYLAAPNVSDRSPTWVSASTLGYVSNATGSDGVYTIGVDGSNPAQVISDGLECWYGP